MRRGRMHLRHDIGAFRRCANHFDKQLRHDELPFGRHAEGRIGPHGGSCLRSARQQDDDAMQRFADARHAKQARGELLGGQIDGNRALRNVQTDASAAWRRASSQRNAADFRLDLRRRAGKLDADQMRP